MPINTTKVAEAAQSFMAYLEQNHEDNELVEVMIIAHCSRSDEDSNDDSVLEHTPTYCSNPSRIYQTGLIDWALESVSGTGEPDDDPEPPE
jgi:hypothetical protein